MVHLAAHILDGITRHRADAGQQNAYEPGTGPALSSQSHRLTLPVRSEPALEAASVTPSIDRTFLLAHAGVDIEQTFDAERGVMAGIDAIIGTIRQAAEDDAAWPAMLEHLSDYLGVVEATLGGGIAGAAPEILAPRTDPAQIARYFSTYAPRNMLMRFMLSQSPGQLVVDEAMADFDGFVRDSFYNEWCVPQGYRRGAGLVLTTQNGWTGALMLNSRAPLETDQIARFEAVLPTVQQALETNTLLRRFRGLARSSLDVLDLSGQAAILLDGRGLLLDANAGAAALLESGRLVLRQRRLGCADGAADRRLSRLLALCLSAPDHSSGGRLDIPTPQGVLSVHCAPYPGGRLFPSGRRPAVIVIITDPQQKLRRKLLALRQKFGLTAAEAELTLALVETGSRKTAAADRGVSDATARAQLTSIFDKTGVRRQMDLVRLVLESD